MKLINKAVDFRMIKDIIFQHKKEKEDFLAKNYVQREKLDSAQKFLETDLVKVITGPRRAGKSVFSTILLKDKNFAYLNFDDENLLKVGNYDEILEGIFAVYGQPGFFLFDEIQNLKNWEIFVNKLHRRGYNLVLTGSNSKLLSKELASALTGRHISIEIYPFSFREFLKAKNFEPKEREESLPEVRGTIFNYLNEYLRSGGFPEIVVKNLEPKTYLSTLFDSILLNDVVKRYKVRFSQKIYDLAVYLISNFSGEFSFNKLKNILDFNSVNTLQNYLRYLQEAYLVFFVNRFSYKVKEQIKTPKKIYLVDNGLIAGKSLQFSPDYGRLMENLVFGELLRRGYQPNKSIFFYKTRNKKEVDFVLKEGFKVRVLIQVCYQIADLEVEKRETKALLEAGEELNCNNFLIITWDVQKDEEIKGNKINFIPLWKWLLDFKI